MKLVTIRERENLRVGAVINEEYIVDLLLAYQEKLMAEGDTRASEKASVNVPSNTIEFLNGGSRTLAAAQQAVDFVKERLETSKAVMKKEEVIVGPPVPEPKKIICVGHNYREHILEMGRDLPEFPVLFAKFSNTVIGPEDEIPYFPITEKLDYEAEFAVVIGKKAKDIPMEEALDYVAGYTIVNDVTSRDLQRRTIQWFQGKSVDGSAPMGPWLVTKDEIPSPDNLEIFLTVNGEERQRSNTSNLVFSVPFLVNFLSSIMTLEPGDIILTGTPGGVGVAMDPPTFLQDGDVVSITVEQIGTLENKVKKVEKAKVKQFANQINKSINKISQLIKDQPEEAIRWKPSDEQWSTLQILAHVEEANRFWIQELERTAETPEHKWGRGVDHKERLAAVQNIETVNIEDVLLKINSFKASIRSTLLSLDDHTLEIKTTHRNPKFGVRPLGFLVEHFMVEHLDKHIGQIGRNISAFNSQTMTTR